MDDKKLRKISKKELLEILLSQAKRIEELEQKLEKTESKLNSKRITIDNSGSLAEASLKLNGIFESAEETAKQYLFNIKEKCKKIELETKKACQIEKENMIKETEKLCEKKKQEADKYLKQVESKIKKTEKNTTKNKTTRTNAKDNNVNNQIIENKVVIEKSKKAIKGKPIRSIKKRNAS